MMVQRFLEDARKEVVRQKEKEKQQQTRKKKEMEMKMLKKM